MTIELKGRIDSGNAARIEQEILKQLESGDASCVILDAKELDYISSAGLRVILRLKKTYPDVRIRDVSSDVYEILDMTGFTEMMRVEKAYRVVSVEGCEVIGEGFNGKVYRIEESAVQSQQAFKSGLSYAGKPMRFHLTDSWGMPIPEALLYRPKFREKCAQCGMRPACNGCSSCGKCEEKRT